MGPVVVIVSFAEHVLDRGVCGVRPDRHLYDHDTPQHEPARHRPRLTLKCFGRYEIAILVRSIDI